MEMEQLLNMGFPAELAAEALAATGGESIAKATDWIFSLSDRPPNPNPNPTATPNPNQSSPPQSQSLSPSPFNSQPKLDQFFPFHSKSMQAVAAKQSSSPSAKDPQNPIRQKRLKLSPPSPSPKSSEPLAERMRPRVINEIIGQDHVLGPSSLLGSAVKCNRLPSIIFWGPPGTGKTSIAKAIASSASLSYKFISLSAVTSGVKDVRDAVEEARKLSAKSGKRTVLFVDEVHRFNKSQQDSFLPVIEDGSIVFIGATTENPSFHLVTPLLSRCRVLTLNPLLPSDVARLLKRAVDDLEKGLSYSVGMRVEVEDGVIELLSSQCDGDARVALNALEVCATRAAGRVHGERKSSGVEEKSKENPKNGSALSDDGVNLLVTVDDAKEALQCKHLAYDRAGEEHYNIISALHKSMRGSDADAALYWLARMLEGGEQPLYIARRLVRFASEDVGLADPNAILQAVACYQACHFIGMPECNVNLAQCVAYLALAPKSVAVYQAIKDAQREVKESVGGNEGVPLHLRNAPTKLMKDIGYGKDYIYTPDDPSATQTFLPPSLIGRKFLEWLPNDA